MRSRKACRVCWCLPSNFKEILQQKPFRIPGCKWPPAPFFLPWAFCWLFDHDIQLKASTFIGSYLICILMSHDSHCWTSNFPRCPCFVNCLHRQDVCSRVWRVSAPKIRKLALQKKPQASLSLVRCVSCRSATWFTADGTVVQGSDNTLSLRLIVTLNTVKVF